MPQSIQTAELIPVTRSTISKIETLMVNARELHAFLGVRRDFSTWIKGRIDKYEFAEGVDFIPLTKFGERPVHEGGSNRIDYALTVDMAKQLAMVENNEKGRIIRRYFIECERRAREAQTAALPNLTSNRASIVAALREHGPCRGVALVGPTGLAISQVHRALAALVRRGVVTRRRAPTATGAMEATFSLVPGLIEEMPKPKVIPTPQPALPEPPHLGANGFPPEHFVRFFAALDESERLSNDLDRHLSLARQYGGSLAEHLWSESSRLGGHPLNKSALSVMYFCRGFQGSHDHHALRDTLTALRYLGEFMQSCQENKAA